MGAPKLTVLKNGQTLKTYEVSGEVALGRGQDCVICLEDRAISRKHALFKAVVGGVQVEGQSEFSPLKLNGADCQKALLKDADVIAIGPYLIRVSLEAQVAVATVSDEMGGREQQVVASEVSGESIESEESSGDRSEAFDESQDAVDLSSDSSPVPEMELGLEPANFEESSEEDKTRVASVSSLRATLMIAPGLANHTHFEITREEISIGRGSDCDIVLNDKKASRKNTIIRRVGASYRIKDLNSANGTAVDGESIQEADLPGKARIRVGNTEFDFAAVDVNYAKSESDFLPITEDPVESMDSGLGSDFLLPSSSVDLASEPPVQTQAPLEGLNSAGITGIGPGDPSRMGIVEKIKNFKTLPPKQKVFVVLTVFAGLYVGMLLLEDESAEPTKGKSRKPKTMASARPSAGPGSLLFENLAKEKQAFIEAQRNLAFDYFKNREYDKALFELDKIFSIIADYKDAKDIQRFAREGKRQFEVIDEERRKREEAERLKLKVSGLLDDARERMARKYYEQARELFTQITLIDPDNVQVGIWKRQIEDEEEKQKQADMARQIQHEMNKKAWSLIQEGRQLRSSKRFQASIDLLLSVKELGAADTKVVPEANRLIALSRSAISGTRDPLLLQAKDAEVKGDLPGAFEYFRQATKADPLHPAGYAGMNRIRTVLHDRAQAVYREGIVAEGFSDFSVARKKFQECLKIAPKDDTYHERSQKKLDRYPQSLFKEEG